MADAPYRVLSVQGCLLFPAVLFFSAGIAVGIQNPVQFFAGSHNNPDLLIPPSVVIAETSTFPTDFFPAPSPHAIPSFRVSL